MSWGRIDDTLDENPKFADLPLAAAGLWLLMLPQALRRGDGFVPETHLRRIRDRSGRNCTRNMAQLLADHGLWEPVEGGWLIHDFDCYARKDRTNAERQARYRDRHRNALVTPRARVPVPVPVTQHSLAMLVRVAPEVTTENGHSNGTSHGTEIQRTPGQQGAAWYVDACHDLGVSPAQRTIPRVGQEVKRLLELGRNAEHVQLAVQELARRNASPTVLESILGDVERTAAGVPMGRAMAAPLMQHPIAARRQQTRAQILSGGNGHVEH